MTVLSKVMQIPSILGITGATIRIQHPDLSSYPRTTVISSFTNGGTTLLVADNNDFTNAELVLLGEVQDEKTEYVAINGAVTRGTSLTIANTTKFDHEIHSPVTKIYEYQIKVFGAATDGGSGTLINTIDIQWNKEFSEYTIKSSDTAYNFYYACFYDGTTTGSASDYVAKAGMTYASVENMVQEALGEVDQKIDGITREWLLTVANDWQQEIDGFMTQDGVSKDWSWQIFEDNTTLLLTENENKYSLADLSVKYPSSVKTFMTVRVGTFILKPLDISYYDKLMESRLRDSLKVATSAGVTSITLNNSAEFDDSGTFYLGPDNVTYTTNTRSTGVLSGIPASGSGSISQVNAIGATVWQNVSPQRPNYFAVWNNYILLDAPVSTEFVGYPIRIKGVKRIPRLTSMTDSTTVPFTYTFRLYAGARIKNKKGLYNEGNLLMQQFKQALEMEAVKDGLPTPEQTTYYNFTDENPMFITNDPSLDWTLWK